ncbi:hypothetical protein ACEPAG_9555 [Sanghuangporus baumii]
MSCRHLCLSKEIFTAKSQLKSALDLTPTVQDKHLCALVLAVISISYFRTAEQHSRPMLETCAQLAAGPGATQTQPSSSPSKEGPGSTVVSVSNTPLWLWVGQGFLGDVKARHQESINARLQAAIEDLAVLRKAPSSSQRLFISLPQLHNCIVTFRLLFV